MQISSILNILKAHKKIFIGVISFLGGLVLFISWLFYLHITSQQQYHLRLLQLNRIENNLTLISKLIQKNSVFRPFSQIDQQLQTMNTLLTHLNTENNFEQLETIIKQNNQIMIDKLQTLQPKKTVIAKIKPRAITHFVSIHTLPFVVTGIDIWNGEPKASIYSNGRYDLMGKADIYQGWTLSDISFEPAFAVFQHEQNKVKVSF